MLSNSHKNINIESGKSAKHPFLQIFFATVLVLHNELFSFGNFGYIISLIEFFLVMIFLVVRRTDISIYLQFAFSISSLEKFQSIYSFLGLVNYRTVEFIGISLSTIAWILISGLHALNIRKKIKTFSNGSIKIAMFVFLTLGTIIGVFGILFDDYSFKGFISDFQYWLLLTLLVWLISLYSKQVTNKLVSFYLDFLTVKSFFVAVMLFSGYYRLNYGGIEIVTYDPVIFFGPVVILYAVHKRVENRVLKFIRFLSSLLWIVISIFQASGKGLILVGIVIFLTFINYKVRVVLVFSLLFGLFVFFSYIYNAPLSTRLFTIKLDQVREIFSFAWLTEPYKLSKSPRDRVLELYNTVKMYICEYPYQVFLGRGFGGYFVDKWYPNPELTGSGDYSREEIAQRKFYYVHESFNHILLKFGILGFIFFFIIIYRITNSKLTLPDKIIALFSFIFFLGFSLSLVAVLAVMLSEVENKYDNLKEKFSNAHLKVSCHNN